MIGCNKRLLPVVAVALFFSAGCLNFNINITSSPAPLSEVVISGKGKERVLIIPIEGTITAQSGGGMVGRGSKSTLAHVTAQLDAARKDKRIKAVVLKIDSPGGVVSACDAIYEELARYKKDTGTVVVAQQMSLAASGGYYLSMVADKVFAQPTTITGSVGVILMKLNAQGLLARIGIEDDSVKSGKSKGSLSMLKDMTPAEREMLQGILDSMHRKFIEVVQNSRKNVVDPSTAFDGRVFIGPDALERNMVDRIGYLPDAIEEAKAMAGLAEATVIRLATGNHPGMNAYSDVGADSGNLASVMPEPLSMDFLVPDSSGPQFMYLWGR